MPRPNAAVPLEACRILQLPKIADPRGNLTFIEGDVHVPFDIQRVYYLYDVPGGADRGGHAHKSLQQLLIAMSGSFDVLLDDGNRRQRFHLNRSYYGLYIGPMIWRELDNFSSGSMTSGMNTFGAGTLNRNARRLRSGARTSGPQSADLWSDDSDRTLSP